MTNKPTYYLFLLLLGLLIYEPVLLLAQTTSPRLVLGENYRIHPSEVTQTEVFIVKNPLDDNNLFASCNTLTFIPFFISEGIYTTENGGAQWTGTDSCTGDPLQFHGGDPGIAIDKNGRFILTRLGRSPFVGLYSHYSDDNGRSWSPQLAISTDDLERASIASDVNSNSPYYGRTYAAWVKFAHPFPVMFSFTNDGAEEWSIPKAINNPPNRSAGGDLAIGTDGSLYLCWAGVTESSPFKEIHVGFASSDNGGDSWSTQEKAFPMNGITGLLPDKANIRVNGLPGIAIDQSGGERHGWLYIVTGQKDLLPAGSDPDVVLHRSSDGGQNWSEGIRVNQDEINNGKTQYFPTVYVDDYGGVDVIFYDDRNTSSDSSGVYLARSTDGGDSWKEFEISDHNAKPQPIGGLGQGYQGDNIDLTATATTLWPVWMDNSSGNYQIWTSPIEFEDVDGVEETVSRDIFELYQNQPNPFREETQISYSLKSKQQVKLTVSDGYGKPITVLADDMQAAGAYQVNFSPTQLNLRPGLYYYSLQVGQLKTVKKMLLID